MMKRFHPFLRRRNYFAAIITGIFIYSQFYLYAQSDVTSIPCSDCHAPNNWRPLIIPMKFEHDKTKFPLEGMHRFADCIQCHVGDNESEIHQFDQATSECVSCHMDIHFNGFGSECRDCHSLESWDMTGWWRKHEYTLFPLTGAHATLECNVCHGAEFYRIASNLSLDCSGCHNKVYLNELSTGKHPENEDCIFCHNTRVWFPIDMSHHDRLFPIFTGRHRGTWTSCNAECHIDPQDYSIFSCGLNGVCHEHNQSKMDDKHRKEGVSGYVYESSACFDCHKSGKEGDGD